MTKKISGSFPLFSASDGIICGFVDNFSDAALLLIGHGSTVNADSKAPTCQHADELRRRKIFAEVHVAFWKEPPFIPDVLAAIKARRIFVVPVFISEGYFTQEAIPRALGLAPGISHLKVETFPFVKQRGEQTLIYCGPIGTHESMTDVLLARAKAVVEQFPFPRAPRTQDTNLFIAGHGTERNENSRKAIERQVEILRGLGIYQNVHAVFMDEEPRIADCYALATTKNMVVVPFFISDGMHTAEDIPLLLGEAKRIIDERLKAGQPTWRNPTEKQGKRVWYSASIGNEPHIPDVILQRVREGAMQKRDA